MAAAATLAGVILGSFVGLGVFTAVNGADTCASYTKVNTPFGARTVCVQASERPYVVVAVLLCVLLCHLWMWWMLRDD